MTSKCFKCRRPGHFAANCPLLLRADTWDDHLERIDMFVDLMVSGDMDREDKRRAIGAENELWYGYQHPALTARRLAHP